MPCSQIQPPASNDLDDDDGDEGAFAPRPLEEVASVNPDVIPSVARDL
jgi:hypothetical protein